MLQRWGAAAALVWTTCSNASITESAARDACSSPELERLRRAGLIEEVIVLIDEEGRSLRASSPEDHGVIYRFYDESKAREQADRESRKRNGGVVLDDVVIQHQITLTELAVEWFALQSAAKDRAITSRAQRQQAKNYLKKAPELQQAGEALRPARSFVLSLLSES